MSRHSNGLQRPEPCSRLSLRLDHRLSIKARGQIRKATAGIPPLTGRRISISVKDKLTAHRGELLSGSNKGQPVHAASFIRKRRIVLERELLARVQKLRLIVVHEIFHFVWARLGNPARRSFAGTLEQERSRHASGGLGESSELRKSIPCWKDYVCESFCDTAAWMYAGVRKHPDFTLALRWRNQRRAWFESYFGGPRSY
jgi:hypothetical protein